MRSKIYRPQRQAESSTEEQSYDSPVPHLEPSKTSSGCQNCKDLDHDNHCLRQFVVNRAHDAFKYENSVLTNAEPDDLLKPKLSKVSGTCISITAWFGIKCVPVDIGKGKSYSQCTLAKHFRDTRLIASSDGEPSVCFSSRAGHEEDYIATGC